MGGRSNLAAPDPSPGGRTARRGGHCSPRPDQKLQGNSSSPFRAKLPLAAAVWLPDGSSRRDLAAVGRCEHARRPLRGLPLSRLRAAHPSGRVAAQSRPLSFRRARQSPSGSLGIWALERLRGAVSAGHQEDAGLLPPARPPHLGQEGRERRGAAEAGRFLSSFSESRPHCGQARGAVWRQSLLLLGRYPSWGRGQRQPAAETRRAYHGAGGRWVGAATAPGPGLGRSVAGRPLELYILLLR